MQIVLGPVLTRKGGYAFDCWTPEEGLSRAYIYGRIEDAHYARNVEIRSRSKGSSDQTIACSTVDDFVRLTLDLRGRQQSACRSGASVWRLLLGGRTISDSLAIEVNFV